MTQQNGPAASTIQADFDRIAQFSTDGWGHNSHYHDLLLKHVPPNCANALEIGCGTGAFARRLATRSRHVLGLDLSPQMVRLARERSKPFTNVEYRVADAMTWDCPRERYDCVASLATLHHLPLGGMLLKMKDALRPGGVLLVLDLFQSEGAGDALTSVLAVPAHCALKLLKGGWRRASQEERKAWAEHGRHDSYLTLTEIRRVCARVLPGAHVQKHLLWRYSIVWRKPDRPVGSPGKERREPT
jgi:SAM-dependent methyltransferase